MRSTFGPVTPSPGCSADLKTVTLLGLSESLYWEGQLVLRLMLTIDIVFFWATQTMLDHELQSRIDGCQTYTAKKKKIIIINYDFHFHLYFIYDFLELIFFSSLKKKKIHILCLKTSTNICQWGNRNNLAFELILF